MGKYLIGSLLVGTLFGLMLLPLSGCAKKTVTLEPGAETGRVDDTTSVGVISEPIVPSQVPPTGSVENLVGREVAEGAGPSESLDTPLAEQPDASGTLGSSGSAGMGEARRTSEGFLPVYFDFDKSVIRQDQLERLAANVRFLNDNPLVKVRIEGNCDDQGTNEYNLALGERRAESARKYLLNMGVAPGRLVVLSYGEERPLKIGTDEVARAENRRDDFVVIP